MNLNDEIWRYTNDNSLHANATELISNEQSDLSEFQKFFGHKDFLKFHAQGFPSYILQRAYKREEAAFMKTVKCVHISAVPPNANIISSHVIYKVKLKDDGGLEMKSRIAPHGNKDEQRFDLRTDSATCPPTGIRIVTSIARIFKWILVKIDFKSAFLQTGKALRDVYVIPPYESRDRQFYWLLLTAAYGLVNANAKWQKQSDDCLRDLGFKQLLYVPQLFYIQRNNEPIVLAVKVVDDVLFAGETPVVNKIVQAIESRYQLRTVVRGPGRFLFFGLRIEQDENFDITVDADQKLDALEAFPISRARRKNGTHHLNSIEQKAFNSLNSSLGWLGIAASPLCSFYSSYLQQRAPTATVSDLISQINYLRVLKKTGTAIHFALPEGTRSAQASIMVFSDAGRKFDHGQLSVLAGLLLGDTEKYSVFHTLSWISHKSKRPVKSVGAAEILAAGEAIDEGKLLRLALTTILPLNIDFMLVLDSRDLFNSLSTCRNSADRSIRADVNVIRYEFESRNVSNMMWVPGKVNLADPCTKPNSPLTDALQLLLQSGKLPFGFPDSEIRSSNRSTG